MLTSWAAGALRDDYAQTEIPVICRLGQPDGPRCACAGRILLAEGEYNGVLDDAPYI
jgi:hypothetical protein